MSIRLIMFGEDTLYLDNIIRTFLKKNTLSDKMNYVRTHYFKTNQILMQYLSPFNLMSGVGFEIVIDKSHISGCMPFSSVDVHPIGSKIGLKLNIPSHTAEGVVEIARNVIWDMGHTI